jgi:hypothetical protein
MGWWALRSLLKLDISDEEVKSLQAGTAPVGTLRKVANIETLVSTELTKAFELDADSTNETFDEEFKNGRKYKVGALASSQWLVVIAPVTIAVE